MNGNLGFARLPARLIKDMSPHSIEVIVLGTAQDGGIPQLGCNCPHCQAAWEDTSLRRLATSLGIVDHEATAIWLVDATPDIREQMNLLMLSYPGYRLTGILLTHAHIGHYLGLTSLGRESWNTYGMPVWGTQRMIGFLRANQPWRQLIDLNNIAPAILKPGSPIQLGSKATGTPILVPHRDELSDTVAFSIAGPRKRLVYCPDIDRWEGPILKAIEEANVALLDGTFYSANELPDRDISKIPHPYIANAIKTFAQWDTDIRFIHLNHSNPLLSNSGLVEQLAMNGLAVSERMDRHRL